MTSYYVNQNAQANGDHEVHTAACLYQRSHMLYLGEFPTCEGAVRAAKQHYPQSNGCYTCSHACHTT